MTYDPFRLTVADFKTAISFEKANEQATAERLLTYYYGIHSLQQKEYRNPVSMLRSALQKDRSLLLELPLASKEIDALCFQNKDMKYTLLNSAQPKIYTNYTLCRTFFYLSINQNPTTAKVKPFYHIHSYNQPDNLRAATFTHLFLLPEASLRSMFYHFFTEQQKEDSTLTILVKLMNYYEVPYQPLLIRCYSLGLLDSGETLEELLRVDFPRIQAEFHRLWLDESLLQPTMRDDFSRLEQLVKSSGETYIQEEYLKQKTLQLALSNMKNIYLDIREG